MTVATLALIAGGYAAKTAVTLVLWRRFGPRVRALGRLARARRTAGRPVLARATPGHVSRTFRLGPPPERRLPAARPGAPRAVAPGAGYRTTAILEPARPTPSVARETA